MSQYLFTVSESFEIKKRGFVLKPGVPQDKGFRVGDIVELRLPDGTVLSSAIKGLEQVQASGESLLAATNSPVGILLSPTISEDAIPPGTEVWLCS